MQYQWLKNEGHEHLIVIFSGWAFGAEIFDHLVNSNCGESYDVLLVNDYRELVIDLPELQNYHARYLLAWSFGVASFNVWQQRQMLNHFEITFDRKVAINGTMHAVDRFLGIPQKVMQKTIDTLSDQSFELFASRCFSADAVPKNLNINVEERKSELRVILQRANKYNAEVSSSWDIVWVSSKDKIFPTKNQLRAWQQYNESQVKPAVIKHCEAPHAPFHLWSSWADIFHI